MSSYRLRALMRARDNLTSATTACDLAMDGMLPTAKAVHAELCEIRAMVRGAEARLDALIGSVEPADRAKTKRVMEMAEAWASGRLDNLPERPPVYVPPHEREFPRGGEDGEGGGA